MLTINITLTASGGRFYPDEILGIISNELAVGRYHQPNESIKIGLGNPCVCDSGLVHFFHPTGECIDDSSMSDYEKPFMAFIAKNYKLLRDNGVEEITLTYVISSKNAEPVSLALLDSESFLLLGEAGVNINVDFVPL